jgi:serine/threonine protein kinase/Tfp pilus assembly protein PilF
MIGETVSRYRILYLLGEGGMGTVYAAEDTILGRCVAVKFLTLDSRKRHYRTRFLREARSVSALSHPNIATVYDYGETNDGVPFIVMELVEGELLGKVMQGGGLTIVRALEIIEGVVRALAEAHRHNIIHRDIKPTNIALDKRGEVKVLDFGLAKQLGDKVNTGSAVGVDAQALLATQTREGIVVGTPMYLSPEQALGAQIDARSDLFSLGSVLYECITGQPAFPGYSAAEVCAKVIRDDPLVPSSLNPDVPSELDRVTLKALAKPPGDRYQSAEELLADLRPLRESLRTAEPLRVRTIPVKPIAPRTSFLSALSDKLRRPWLFPAIFLACLALALAAVWFGSSRSLRGAMPPPEFLRLYKIGTNALRDGTYDRAVKSLEKATSIYDDFPLAHARMAEALTELEYTDRAKNELLRAMRSDHSEASPLDALALQAINLSLTGDPRGAIEVYRKLVEQAKDDEERAAAYVDLGRAYERSSDLARAEESYRAAIGLDPQNTAATMHLGIIYGRRQGAENTAAALSYFETAEARYRMLNDAEGLAEVSYQRGVMFVTQRRLGEAREELAQALSKAEAIDDKYQQVKIRMQLSSVFCLEGNTPTAESYASAVLDFAKANGLEVLMANGFATLGSAFLARGDLVQAQKYYQRALDVAEIYKARRSEARALLSLASLASQHHSRPDEVRGYVERALPIVQQDGYQKFEMQAQALLGHASDQQGDYAFARAAFERQLQLATQLDDREQASLAQEGVGIALLHQEDYAKAVEYFDRNLESARSLGLAPNITHALANRGRVLWLLGRYDEAQQSLSEALQRAESVERPDAELLARLRLTNAQQALSRRQFDTAETYGRAALKMAGTEFEAIAVEAQATVGLAQALSGTARAGVKACEEAVDAARKLGTPRLVASTFLSLSQARLESGDTKGALSAASEARETFKGSGQQDSEWRALLIAALASKQLGYAASAQAYAKDVSKLLAVIEQRLGADAYRLYLARPDLQYAHKQLVSEFAL